MHTTEELSLSIIIPVKVNEDNGFIVDRLENIVLFFEISENIEIVIVDSTEDLNIRNFIIDISKKKCNAKYLHSENKEPYSAAAARNTGVKACSGDYVIFFDVDLLARSRFFNDILGDAKKLKKISKNAFTIYPCLYLSENFSKAIEFKLDVNKKEYLEKNIHNAFISCLAGSKNKVLYPAVNTSTILVSKEHFLSIGGYKECFSGHGYEDFFLIHELSYYYPLARKGRDYSRDYKTDYPGLYLGFRRYFSFYALENIFRGMYTVHLYHERDRKRDYYLKREENSRIFQKRLNVFSNTISTTSFLRYDNYQSYIKYIITTYGYTKTQVSGLYKKSQDESGSYLLYRKARKLMLNPRKFFKDIRFKRYWY